jgi:hypothetical protein
MIEIALALALGIIVVVLLLHRYWFPILVVGLGPYWFSILVHRYLFSILVIGCMFIGVAYLVCVVTVCIPAMMAALQGYHRENPNALHTYAMIVGALGLIAAAYYFWDLCRQKAGSQDRSPDSAHLPLDS